MRIANLLTAGKIGTALAVGFAAWLAQAAAPAPAPPAANPTRPVESFHYRDTPGGKIMDAIFTGVDSTSLPGGAVQVRQFRMTGIRNGQATNVAVIAEAPECQIDYNRKEVGDPGPIQIYTPATNLFAQGVGFHCAESNQVLLLSNQVRTRVLKSMLRSTPLFQPASNAAPDAGQVVEIHSGRGQFDFRSNLADYSDQVRVIDPQYQLDSPLLSIQFASNQTVETMFARRGVTLTFPGKGTATGATAHYFATNDNPLLELAGDADSDARWQNGEQEARAARFTYEPNRHILTAGNPVRVRWPSQIAGGMVPRAFFQLFADDASLQMTSDGATVERMTAGGNVILANQADQSSATAGKAVYDRPRDLLILTEDPVWWNDRMEVRGDTLTLASSNKVYHAQGNARLKLRVSGAAGALPGSTNQWLYVSADDILSQPVNSQTNLVTFRGDVLARLLDGEQLQDTLTAEVLLVTQLAAAQGAGDQVVLVVAREDVKVQTARDAAGVTKTVSGGMITARRSPATGLWQSVVAEEDAALESFGSGSAAVSNHLTAAVITARFSPVTNQIESAVAEGAVVLDQTAPGRDGPGSAAVSNHLTAAILTAHFSSVTNQIESAVAEGAVTFTQSGPGKSLRATGGRAVYTVAPEEQVELTGHPWAQTDRLTILDADRLNYAVQSGAVDASGRYHIIISKNTPARAPASAPPPP
jgi:lipopolysaccharide export system protein LptA